MATFKLELTGTEASVLRQIIDAGNIPNKVARVVASIQNKFDAAAKTHNDDAQTEKNSSSPPDTPKTESPRLDGDKGGEDSQ